eukprot:SAG11_NODE_1450_length_4883_cov_2.373955_5_plen_107_part_00
MEEDDAAAPTDPGEDLVTILENTDATPTVRPFSGRRRAQQHRITLPVLPVLQVEGDNGILWGILLLAAVPHLVSLYQSPLTGQNSRFPKALRPKYPVAHAESARQA